MRITAKVDYAVRAAVELAAHGATNGPKVPMKGDAVATAQDIPVRFLETILAELRRSGMVSSQRGSEGGYWLARPAGEISVADVIRAVEGPLANVHGAPPEEVDYDGAARSSSACGSPPGWRCARCSRPPPWLTSRAEPCRPASSERAGRPDGWARR